MLIDGDEVSNFIVDRTIKKVWKNAEVTVCLDKDSAMKELLALKQNQVILPDIIFIETGTPSMNGWDFLEEYSRLIIDKEDISRIVVLSWSLFRRDIDHALSYTAVKEYFTKPLKMEDLDLLFQNPMMGT